ncbi:MAG: biotin synthase BioB, partial [Deltaproteobacteria bacterium]|nr:biotin synthase BioB [Deltaproteobacteria bacterium]
METILEKALEKGMGKAGLSYEDALEFTRLEDEGLFDMLSVSDRVRRHHKGLGINLCSIVNAKSGLCSEDCTFCSQSVKYQTGVAAYPMVEPRTIVNAAKKSEA